MATGTGKTVVAFHICWKLWSSRWNRKNEPQRKPRILYLAGRNFLVDEIIGKFGGPDQLRDAVNQLQSLLYAA